MTTTEAFRGLECIDCGAVHEFDATACADCGGALDPAYDRDALDPDAVRAAAEVAASEGAWALDAVLPFEAATGIDAGEGGTPLVDADRLAEELGVGRVRIKDESRNPTGTVLDRGVALAVTAADAADAEVVAGASPGDAGQSTAAYAGRRDLRSYAFVPSRAPFSNKALINVHGGTMRVAGGRLGDAEAALAEELAADYYPADAFRTPYRHEGAKAIAYEVLAESGWSAPDAVVVPTATGELLVGLERGFREARDLGLVDGDAVPALYGVQAAGCAPIARAWREGRSVAPWEHPDTIVGELEVPDPAGGDRAVAAVDATGGAVLAVDDDSILESAVAVAASEVVAVGARGGAAPAGAWALATGEVVGPATDTEGPAGDVAPETGVDAALDAADDVVLLNTETATKTPDVLRNHLIGQGV